MLKTNKQCNRCKKIKQISDYHTNRNICKLCRSVASLKRDRTIDGLIVKMYGQQVARSRVKGFDLPKYTAVELLEWAVKQDNFYEIYHKWVDSDYHKMLIPSVDRIDDYKGYTVDNIQLMTWEENKAKGHHDIKHGINNKQNTAVAQYGIDSVFIRDYFSIAEAARNTGAHVESISRCCNGAIKTSMGFKWEYI